MEVLELWSKKNKTNINSTIPKFLEVIAFPSTSINSSDQYIKINESSNKNSCELQKKIGIEIYSFYIYQQRLNKQIHHF